jgi:GNAT superfamily N-acetyltransferase
MTIGMTAETIFSTDRLQARPLASGDEPLLQHVFEAAGDYFMPITGRPSPDADAAVREIRGCEGTEGREVAVLFDVHGEPVGALGWWQGNPEPDVGLLGMVLMVPEARGVGHAREAVQALEIWLAERGIRSLRTGVGAHDLARQTFVRALGFEPLDERTHVSLDRGRMMITLFQKALPTPD